ESEQFGFIWVRSGAGRFADPVKSRTAAGARQHLQGLYIRPVRGTSAPNTSPRILRMRASTPVDHLPDMFRWWRPPPSRARPNSVERAQHPRGARDDLARGDQLGDRLDLG